MTRARIQLAAIDLDGTLLRTDGSISARTRAALAAAADGGVTVAIASARSPRSVRDLAADLALGGRSPDWPRPEGSFTPCDALAFGRPLTKLLARHADAPLEQLYEHALDAAGESASVTLAGSAFVELAAPGVTKGAALAGLARRLGVAAADVVAFGDQPTDAPMLAWAGTGVAVANAHPAVLAVAAGNFDWNHFVGLIDAARDGE